LKIYKKYSIDQYFLYIFTTLLKSLYSTKLNIGNQINQPPAITVLAESGYKIAKCRALVRGVEAARERERIRETPQDTDTMRARARMCVRVIALFLLTIRCRCSASPSTPLAIPYSAAFSGLGHKKAAKWLSTKSGPGPIGQFECRTRQFEYYSPALR